MPDVLRDQLVAGQRYNIAANDCCVQLEIRSAIFVQYEQPDGRTSLDPNWRDYARLEFDFGWLDGFGFTITQAE